MTPALVASMLAALGAFAFFNASETAAFTLSPADLKRLRTERPRAARALDALLSDRRRFLTAILLGNLIVGLLYFNLVRLAGENVRGGGFLFEGAALAVFVLVGEMAPKVAALRNPGAAAAATAGLLRVAVAVLGPPGAIFSAIARVTRRGRSADEEGDLGPEELARLLEAAARRGALGDDEHAWLRELVLLAEIRVKEAMTPRVDVTAFDLSRPREEFDDLFRKTRRNKIPVFEGAIDKLEGWIDAKIAIEAPERPLRDFVRPIGFIPESATAADALETMRRDGRRILAVVDEYGGFEGVVTREDLVECVFGDLADESDEEVELVKETAPGRFLVDASLPTTESRRVFGTASGASAAATLGGLVVAVLKRLPQVGDEVRIGRVVVRVAAMRGRTASKLYVRHLATPEGDAPPGVEGRR